MSKIYKTLRMIDPDCYNKHVYEIDYFSKPPSTTVIRLCDRRYKRSLDHTATFFHSQHEPEKTNCETCFMVWWGQHGREDKDAQEQG